MRTSFHHQPEAQHPKSPAIETPAGRLPHLLSNSDRFLRRSEMTLSANSRHCTLGLKRKRPPTEAASKVIRSRSAVGTPTATAIRTADPVMEWSAPGTKERPTRSEEHTSELQ